jgi:DNA polymerase-1
MAIIFDTETNSLDIFAKDVVLVCWSDGDETTYTSKDVYALKDRLESNELKIGHNLKFEAHKVANYGIRLAPPYFDTQVAAWLLGMGRPNVGEDGVKYSYGLKDLAMHHLGVVKPVSFKDLAKQYGHKSGRKMVEARASDIPDDVLIPYCCNDVAYTRKLWILLEKQMAEAGLTRRFEKIEMPFIEVLVAMERAGITLDVPYLETYRAELLTARDQCEAKLNELVEQSAIGGVPFQLPEAPVRRKNSKRRPGGGGEGTQGDC